MTSALTQHDLHGALDSVVCEVLSQAGVAWPPVDARVVAAAIGLTVAQDRHQHGRARIVRLRDQASVARASILVRPELRPERLQWAIAHEIGESRIADVFQQLSIDPHEVAGAAREQFANRFASHLLLPTDWFERDARQCDWDLFELKARYATASHELIARRMLDCAPPILISVFDHGQCTCRLSNVPGRIPELSALERATWQQAAATGLDCVQTDSSATVQAWPIHESDWRREILRTEILLDFSP